jgi:hypothetical protein
VGAPISFSNVENEFAASSVSAFGIGLVVRLRDYLSHLLQKEFVWISHYEGVRSLPSVHSMQYRSYAL